MPDNIRTHWRLSESHCGPTGSGLNYSSPALGRSRFPQGLGKARLGRPKLLGRAASLDFSRY